MALSAHTRLTHAPNNARRVMLRYAVLALIALVAIGYQARIAIDVVRTVATHVPFFSLASASNVINLVRADAASAGLRRGDGLVAINGRRYTGTAVSSEEIFKAKPGTSMAVTVTRDESGHSVQKTILLPVTKENSGLATKGLVYLLYVVVPCFCLVLGLWTTAARPRDPLAWLLLGLMLAFPQIFELLGVANWGSGWREAGMTYRVGLGDAWPIFMYFFGLYFPEPFPSAGRYRLSWKILFWIGVVPIIVLAIADVVVSVGEVGNYTAVAPLERMLHPFMPYLVGLSYVITGSFFAAIGTKMGIALSPDSKRRLRLLYAGTTVAMTPALLITVIARVQHKAVFEAFSQPVIISCLALLALFPLTLAYVIIVQRAMDVRVVVRQGLQYALAKNGIRILQILVTGIVITTAVTMASESNRNRPQKIIVIGLGVVAVFTVRRLAERLRAWTDRRFFREAYNAEQVLTELSDQVRTMLELRPLLETVATRISQTLHVPNIAVLVGVREIYQPAYALGYPAAPTVAFTSAAATVKHLRESKEPARVYLEDPNSWVYFQVSDEERTRLTELHSELLLPLAVRDKLLGFISLGPKRSEEPYTGSDLRLLRSVAAQTGLALENANLMQTIADEIAQRERLNREVEIAREVQERLFPQALPLIRGLDYAGHCRPALGVGGDYYDFLALPGGHLGVAIGDVSGKGIAAALTMASLQASLRGEATRAPENLAAAVANINRLVYEASSANRYATFFYGQYNPESHVFDYVNAGHNPPMLFHCVEGKWQVARLEVGGTVVGLLESFPYQQGTIQLSAGDILVAFTDGISEAMNNADEEWGEERLMRTVEACSGRTAGDMLQQIFQVADEFVAGAKQHDDMTLVVLRALNSAANSSSI